MTLSSEQIERYSRQIITPGIGGVAQERLLASRLVIVGETPNFEATVSYLVGAGIGRIDLDVAIDDHALIPLPRSMKALNPDVTVSRLNDASERPNLALAIIAGATSLAAARLLLGQFPQVPWVMARLDAPSRLAILPALSPCPRCASDELLSDFRGIASNAAVVALAAAVEAFAPGWIRPRASSDTGGV